MSFDRSLYLAGYPFSRVFGGVIALFGLTVCVCVSITVLKDLRISVLVVAIATATVVLLVAMRRPSLLCIGYVASSMVTPNVEVGLGTVGLPDLFGTCAVALLLTAPVGRNRDIGSVYFVYLPAIAATTSLISVVLFNPADFGDTLLRVMRLMFAGSVAILFARSVRAERELLVFCKVAALLGAIGGYVSLAIFVTINEVPWAHADQFLYLGPEVLYRGQGFIGESSSLANLCLFCLCIDTAVGRLLYREAVGLLVAGGCLTGVIVSFSRTGMLIALIILMIGAVWNLRTAVIRMIVLTVVCVILLLYYAPVADGLLFRLRQSSGSSNTDFSSGRLDNWAVLIVDWQNPLLLFLGHGYKSISDLNSDVTAGTQLYGDNIFVSAFYETGFLGLSLIVVFVVLAALASSRVSVDSVASKCLRRALLLWLPLELGMGMIGDVFTFSRTMGPWLVLLAGTVAVSANSSRPPKNGVAFHAHFDEAYSRRDEDPIVQRYVPPNYYGKELE